MVFPNPKKKISNGSDYNFFERVTVTDTEFPEECQILFAFRSNYTSFSLINESAVTIEYSFNGHTLHGDLVPNTPSEALAFDNRPISKIWLRAPSSANIRVEAWGV